MRCTAQEKTLFASSAVPLFVPRLCSPISLIMRRDTAISLNRSLFSSPLLVICCTTVPIAPSQGSFLRSSGSSVLLNFSEWKSGGCSIKYFVVQFRSDLSQEWQSLPQPVPGDQEKYLIKDLAVDSWYRLRVGAHNDAGTTEAEYTFSTSSSSASGADRGNLLQAADESSWFSIVLMPVLASVTILVCVGVTVVGIRRKPAGHRSEGGSFNLAELIFRPE